MTNACQPEEHLSAFLDRALSPARMQRVRNHLDRCPACKSKLARLARTDAWLRDLPPVDTTPGFEAAFWSKVARLKEERRRPAWVERWLAGWRPMLAAGLAAGMVAAIVMVLPNDRAPRPEEVFMAENMELLNDFDILQRLELLENWEAIQAMKEQV